MTINEKKAEEILDIALGNKPIEGSTNTIKQIKKDFYCVPLQETTIYNIVHAIDSRELGLAIGKEMIRDYTKEQVKEFCDAIYEGFEKQNKVQVAEDAEIKRLNSLFEQTDFRK